MFHEGSFHSPDLNVDSITKGDDRICYHIRGQLNSQQVVKLILLYALRNSVEWSSAM